MGFVVLFVELVEHEEEVFNIPCMLWRLVVFSADSVSEGVGGNGWDPSE